MRPPTRSGGIGPQALRFLASGALNTLVTYALYCVLVAFLAPQAAYALVFVLGIGLAYALNTRFVFRARMRAASATLYPLVYAVQYGANALLIELFTAAGLGPRLALAIALVVVTPLSFAGNRLLLARQDGARTR
jgi:putative flippase GtrA